MSKDAHELDGGFAVEPERLETWKGIASFFSCDQSTARRWEKSYSMPVHRYGDRGSGVYAYAYELQAWADEYLEVSPEGAAVIAGEQVGPTIEENTTDRMAEPKATSDLASRSGRLRIIVFSLVAITASGYLLLKPHKPSTPASNPVNSQVQSSPAETKNKSLGAVSNDHADVAKKPVEAKTMDDEATNIQAEHAYTPAIRPNQARGVNELRNLVEANPEALQPKRDLAEMLLEQRHIPAALPLEDDIAKISGESRDAVAANALREGWNSGRTVGAFLALLKADQREYAHDRSVSPQMALAALQLGRNEEAVKYLRAALKDDPPQALALANGVFTEKLSSDAAFMELQRTLPNVPNEKPREIR